eukprot:gene4705-8640_t
MALSAKEFLLLLLLSVALPIAVNGKSESSGRNEQNTIPCFDMCFDAMIPYIDKADNTLHKQEQILDDPVFQEAHSFTSFSSAFDQQKASINDRKIMLDSFPEQHKGIQRTLEDIATSLNAFIEGPQADLDGLLRQAETLQEDIEVYIASAAPKPSILDAAITRAASREKHAQDIRSSVTSMIASSVSNLQNMHQQQHTLEELVSSAEYAEQQAVSQRDCIESSATLASDLDASISDESKALRNKLMASKNSVADLFEAVSIQSELISNADFEFQSQQPEIQHFVAMPTGVEDERDRLSMVAAAIDRHIIVPPSSNVDGLKMIFQQKSDEVATISSQMPAIFQEIDHGLTEIQSSTELATSTATQIRILSAEVNSLQVLLSNARTFAIDAVSTANTMSKVIDSNEIQISATAEIVNATASEISKLIEKEPKVRNATEQVTSLRTKLTEVLLTSIHPLQNKINDRLSFLVNDLSRKQETLSLLENREQLAEISTTATKAAASSILNKSRDREANWCAILEDANRINDELDALIFSVTELSNVVAKLTDDIGALHREANEMLGVSKNNAKVLEQNNQSLQEKKSLIDTLEARAKQAQKIIECLPSICFV